MIVVVCLLKAALAFAPNFCTLPTLCIGKVLLVIVMDIEECAADGATLVIAPDVRTLMLGPAVDDSGTSSSCLPTSWGEVKDTPLPTAPPWKIDVPVLGVTVIGVIIAG